ncbi:MAG TPA: hypothetical protein VH593_02510 [Ktedonobacteraceae bacterium]|jgi:hypothetical protein
MGLLAQRRLSQYIDTHFASYQEQVQVALQYLSDSDRHQHAEVLVSHLQHWQVQAKILDTTQQVIYAAYASKAPFALLRYLPISSSDQLVQVLYDIIALKIFQHIYKDHSLSVKWLLDLSNSNAITTLTTAQLEAAQAIGCLWHAPERSTADRPMLALGTKGMLCVELSVQTGQIAPPFAHDAVLPNALWRLLWAIGGLKSSQEDILIEGFYDAVVPADDESTNVLYDLPAQNLPFAQQWGIARPLLDLHGPPFHYAHRLTPTCTIVNITHAPSHEQTLPIQASALLLFHLVPRQDPKDIFQKLCRHLQLQGFDDVHVQLQQAYSPFALDRHHTFVQAVEEANTYTYNNSKAPVLLPLSAGSYPVETLRKAFDIPVLVDLSDLAVETTAHEIACQIKQRAALMALLAKRQAK